MWDSYPLRPQIALLAAGVGDVAGARRQLTALLREVRHTQGSGSPEVADIEAMLAHLAKLDDQNWRSAPGDRRQVRFS